MAIRNVHVDRDDGSTGSSSQQTAAGKIDAVTPGARAAGHTAVTAGHTAVTADRAHITVVNIVSSGVPENARDERSLPWNLNVTNAVHRRPPDTAPGRVHDHGDQRPNRIVQEILENQHADVQPQYRSYEHVFISVRRTRRGPKILEMILKR